MQVMNMTSRCHPITKCSLTNTALACKHTHTRKQANTSTQTHERALTHTRTLSLCSTFFVICTAHTRAVPSAKYTATGTATYTAAHTATHTAVPAAAVVDTVYYDMMQCIPVCCSVLQCVAVS